MDDDDDPGTTNANEDHGTMVASLAVGEGVNKVVGVAYNASYYAVKVLDASEDGFAGDLIAGIEWASSESHKADIISMSLGTCGGGPLWELVWKPALQEACNDAYNADIVLIAGSGMELLIF